MADGSNKNALWITLAVLGAVVAVVVLCVAGCLGMGIIGASVPDPASSY